MKAEGAIWPTGLKPGDKVRFVSPASTPDRDDVFQRARKLEGWGLQVDFGQHAFKKRSYLAGTDEERIADFNAAVLFHYVDGDEPGHHSAEDAKAQGITMARIHAAAGTFPHWNVGGHRLDLDHLLHHPLASVLALELLDDVARKSLSALASRLSSAVAAIGGLTWVRCQGDCHGGNARIARDGPLKGQAIFFDFDDGGPGFLAYDLAVFLWSVSLQREGYSQWHAFIEGYRSVRPIDPIDLEATHLFVPIRHFWLLGNYAIKTVEWGSELVSAKWLARQTEYMLKWEQDKLLPGVLLTPS
jgi:Ser/Thr protein kinase RdoA (MazF antagonist)